MPHVFNFSYKFPYRNCSFLKRIHTRTATVVVSSLKKSNKMMHFQTFYRKSPSPPSLSSLSGIAKCLFTWLRVDVLYCFYHQTLSVFKRHTTTFLHNVFWPFRIHRAEKHEQKRIKRKSFVCIIQRLKQRLGFNNKTARRFSPCLKRNKILLIKYSLQPASPYYRSCSLESRHLIHFWPHTRA